MNDLNDLCLEVVSTIASHST